MTEEVERLCDDEGKEQERGQADVKEGKQQDAEGEWIGKNVEGERKKADDVKERKQQDAKGIGEDVKGERKKAEGEGKDAEGVVSFNIMCRCTVWHENVTWNLILWFYS